MTLRAYRTSDKEKCLEIFRSNMPKFFAAYEEAEFANYLDQNPEYYFVLENPTLIGCGGYGITEATGYLAWGMVHHSQHGAGKRLLLERLNFIGQHGEATSVVLDTSQHTFGFFEKLGFVTQKTTVDGYALGLHRYDMELTLNEDSRNIIQEKLALLLSTKSFANSIIYNQVEND
jgi:[ribosomal protein S18]-alanine N-acetyltransferase